MAEVYADEDYLIWLPLVEEPSIPYWKSIMAAAKYTDKVIVDTKCEENCIFTDSEGKVLAVQMLDPVDNTGAPIESVMEFLKKYISQDHIDELVETVIDVKEQIGIVDDKQIKQFMEMMKDLGE